MRTPPRARMGACETISDALSGPSRHPILRRSLPASRSFASRAFHLDPGCGRPTQPATESSPQPPTTGGSDRAGPFTRPGHMGAEAVRVGQDVGLIGAADLSSWPEALHVTSGGEKGGAVE